MGLVEAVALEGLEGLEDGVDDVGVDTALGSLSHELVLLGAQHRGLLLADGIAQGVRLRTGEAAEGHGGGHDVLLVDEDAVRLLEVRLQQGVQVGDLLEAVLAADVGRDVVHGPGPEEGHHGRQVVDRCGTQLLDVAPHARRLELEDAGRLAAGEELEGPRVVERDALEVDALAALLADEVDGLPQDGQVGEAQEVELEQPQGLHAVHLVLRHQRVRVGGTLEGHELRQRIAADDDAGGMRGGVAGHALQLAGDIDELVDAPIAFVHLAEGRGDLERVLEGDAQLGGDGLGDAVHLSIAVAHDPTDIAHGGASEHRAEGDDLGHVVLPVLAGDVVDDLVAAGILEVDVDVRHRHAVGVEEALEGQLVEDGVDRRDAQRVRDDRAGRRPAAGRGDALLSGEAREVGHDEEVGRVAHRGDDAQLVVEPLAEVVGERSVALREAALALAAQPRLDGVAVRHGEVRQAQLAERHAQVRHLRHALRVEERLRHVGEEGLHLRRRLEVELLRLEAQAVGRVEVGAGAHAEQHVVGLVLVLAHVVQVVGDDERGARLGRQAQQLGVQGALLRQAVVLQLQVEAVRAEDVAVLAGDPAGEVPVVHLERLGDLAAQAGGHADDALAVPGQELTVEARLVVVAVEVGRGDDAAEVLVAGPVRASRTRWKGCASALPSRSVMLRRAT